MAQAGPETLVDAIGAYIPQGRDLAVREGRVHLSVKRDGRGRNGFAGELDAALEEVPGLLPARRGEVERGEGEAVLEPGLEVLVVKFCESGEGGSEFGRVAAGGGYESALRRER